MLDGTLPTSLYELVDLKFLIAQNNHNLTGTISSKMGSQLTDLIYLYLDDNSFTSTLLLISVTVLDSANLPR